MAKPLVMVIEDEVGILTLFSLWLNRFDCDIISAQDGQEALDILQTCTPDVMLLDLALPYVTGVEILNYVRSTPRLSFMRIVIVTARAQWLQAIEPSDYDHWIVKPLGVQDFDSCVGQFLQSTR